MAVSEALPPAPVRVEIAMPARPPNTVFSQSESREIWGVNPHARLWEILEESGNSVKTQDDSHARGVNPPPYRPREFPTFLGPGSLIVRILR